MLNSCIYSGTVAHLRTSPRRHAFNYRLFMMLLDLDELPNLFDRYLLWSARGFNLAWFRRSDHLAGRASLKETILDQVETETGERPQGRVCLLTHLRYFGYAFNPASFYYCYNPDIDNGSPVNGNSDQQASLHSIVVEVNNTPWGERHIYVLPITDEVEKAVSQPSGHHHFKRDKVFHVSPFMPMDLQYTWAVSVPATRLSVRIENSREGKKFFTVSMALSRTPLNHRNLARALLNFPLMTVKVITAIYFEALRLFVKRIPIYSHNSKQGISK